MISPAELNSLTTAALAGNGVLSSTNNFFSSRKAAILDVSLDVSH